MEDKFYLKYIFKPFSISFCQAADVCKQETFISLLAGLQFP